MTRKPLGVLILHGFTSSLDCVRGVESAVKALNTPTRVPILRGHGADSPEALRGVTWHDWATDAEVALRELSAEVEQAIVFGHSMGGLVALTLAADHADIIDSLVVAAAAVQLSSPFAPGRPLSVLAPLVAALRDKLPMPPVYADPSLAQHDTNYAWAPSDAVFSLLAFSKRTRRRLSEVNIPILILQSRNDSTVAPESAEIIYEQTATSPAQKRIVWFDETEHEMFRDCEREAAIAAVAGWVRERSRQTRSP
jgi:carboxylesterase